MNPRSNQKPALGQDQLQTDHTCNMNVQYQSCTYGTCNGATLLFFKIWGLQYRQTDVQMDGQSHDNQNFLD